MFVVKGVNRQKNWYGTVPRHWPIGVTDTGWATDELGWL